MPTQSPTAANNRQVSLYQPIPNASSLKPFDVLNRNCPPAVDKPIRSSVILPPNPPIPRPTSVLWLRRLRWPSPTTCSTPSTTFRKHHIQHHCNRRWNSELQAEQTPEKPHRGRNRSHNPKLDQRRFLHREQRSCQDRPKAPSQTDPRRGRPCSFHDRGRTYHMSLLSRFMIPCILPPPLARLVVLRMNSLWTARERENHYQPLPLDHVHFFAHIFKINCTSRLSRNK